MSWEVDDRKRDEEDEAGANLRMRRGRFVNDKVDMEEDFVDDKKGRRKVGLTCFLNCAAGGEHFPILMPKVPQRRRPRVF